MSADNGGIPVAEEECCPAAARARGRTGGRRPALSRDQIEIAQGPYDAGEKTPCNR